MRFVRRPKTSSAEIGDVGRYRTNYERKRAQGKTTKEALRCLERRIFDRIFVTLRASVLTEEHVWAAVPSLYESLAKARLEVIDGEAGGGGEGRARGSELMIRMTLWSSTSLTDLAPGRAICATPQALRPAHIPLKHARPVDDATGHDEPCRCGKRARGRVKETQNG